ncbi:MAG: class I SAM-dependent methyltransferase [Gemmatimonadota bacterium]
MTTPEPPLVSATALPPGFDDPGIPRIPVEPVESCVVCGSREWNPFAEGYDYDLRTCRNRWHFVACALCDHVRLHPRPRTDTLGIIHPATPPGQASPLARRISRWLDQRSFKHLRRHLITPPESYLDASIGNGRWLDLMAAQGVKPGRILGLEPDPGSAESLRGKGYQIFDEPADRCSGIPAASIELVTLRHGVGQVERPDLIIRRLSQWLAPGGVLALVTPSLDSWDARLFRERYWGGYQMPRNWHLFTPDTLTKLVTAAGLDLVAIHYQPNPGAWLRSLHHRLRYGASPHPPLAAVLDPPERSGLAYSAATLLDLVRAGLHSATSAMLLIARKPGSRPD